jgi:prepilin-type N-terminal cleavage/methylation domain-containing protein
MMSTKPRNPATPSRRTAAPPVSAARRAFSILELLIVIGIMAILAAMTMAIGPGLLRSSAMNSSLSAVASAVSLARSEAIRSRKPTFFALAPTNSDRGFLAYAIIRKDGTDGVTNFTYITPWKKLPTGVLFNLSNSVATMTNASLPYDKATSALTNLPAIGFVSDGALDEDMHPEGSRPILPLQVGTRSGTDAPAYQGAYTTNQILVERLSGKVKVERAGDVPK